MASDELCDTNANRYKKRGVVEKRGADTRKDESVELTVATISGGLVAMGLYVFLIEPLWMLPRLEWLTPGILYRVKTREALVGLSFDDGPHAVFTAEVLEILERYGAKATFFLIGERAERHPELVERMRAAGHEIGNHCWRDGTVLGHSRKRFAEELKKTELAVAPSKSGPLRKAGPTTAGSKKKQIPNPPKGGGFGMTINESGDVSIEYRAATAALKDRRYTDTIQLPTGTRFFRAPGGVAWPWQLKLARERGYTCVLGCAYPHDPMRPPVKYIRWLIEKNLRPGTIVILHDGIRDATRSVEALPQILEEGTRRGFRFVSIGGLVDSRGDGG